MLEVTAGLGLGRVGVRLGGSKLGLGVERGGDRVRLGIGMGG